MDQSTSQPTNQPNQLISTNGFHEIGTIDHRIDWDRLVEVHRCSFAPSSSRCRIVALVLLHRVALGLWVLSVWCESRVLRAYHLLVRELLVALSELEEMGDDPLAVDARIKLSIGTKETSDADGQFYGPASLAFDHHRGLLLVVDFNNHRVQVLSLDDDDGDEYRCSFVSKFGGRGDQPDQFEYPYGLAIDHDHDRIVVVDSGNHRVQSWSLSEQSFLSCIGHRESRDIWFYNPHGIAIDKHHHRIIVDDTENHRLVFLSSIDLSLLFSIGVKKGSRHGDLDYPSGIAVDHDRHRIIVADTLNNRVQVLSLIDGSFLFEFGSQGNQPGQFLFPSGACIDNQGRIIVADYFNIRLQSFTHEGHHISSFDCGTERPSAVAFDEHRGLIAFSAGNRVHVIGANQWLADTFIWRVDLHRYAPSWMKQAVSAMTMIRSLVDDSAMSMIPNELLFEIFSFL